MAIKEIKKKNGETVYRTQIYLGIDSLTGKKVKASVTAKTKKELKRKELQRRLEFEKNGSTVKRNVQVQFYHELVELWKESIYGSLQHNTVKTHEWILNNYLLPKFGDMKVEKITTLHIQDFANELANEYNVKGNGISNYRRVLSENRRILSYGVSLGVIKYNPAIDITIQPTKINNEKPKWFTQEELKLLLPRFDKMETGYYRDYASACLFKFLLATGLRIGEAIALTWQDIDLDNGTVTINKTLNGQREVVAPKTKSSYRTISIDKSTLLMMRMFRARSQQRAGTTDLSVVFWGKNPRTPKHTVVERLKLRRILADLGLERRSLHAFRHTHATMMVRAGMPPKELQYRMGHSDISITLGIYTHFSEELEKKSAEYYEKAIDSL